jgi:hypothetical protein
MDLPRSIGLVSVSGEVDVDVAVATRWPHEQEESPGSGVAICVSAATPGKALAKLASLVRGERGDGNFRPLWVL